MTATREGVEVRSNRRNEQMADILKNREVEIDQELKEGGTAEGIAVLQRDTVIDADPLRPEDIPAEDWAAMSDEQKNLAIKDAKTKADEAAAAETPEAKAAREAKEKEEADKKASVDASAQAAAGAGTPRKVRLKVDGQDVEVDEAAVLEAGRKALQKETAADQRLEQAAKAKQEAQALFVEAQNMIKAAAKGAATVTDGEAGSSGKDGRASIALTDAQLTDTVKAIQYGSAEEAKQALQNLIAAAAGSGQSEELTAAQVAEMLDFREAKQWVESEYKDVLGDVNLRRLFLTKEREKRAAGDTRPYRELYADLGNEVREWRKSLNPAVPTPPADPAKGGRTAAAIERKTTLVPVPSASARQPAPTQTKAPSPSETIESMRKARTPHTK